MGSVIDGPAFLGDEVKLKEGTHLTGPVIVDKYSVVDEDARVINSVIWPHTYIGEGCVVRQAVIGRGVTIKNNTVVEEGAVVGDDCVIGKGSRIQAGVRIWPHKEIAPGSTVNELGGLGGGVAARALRVLGDDRPDQRRADPGVLRPARRRLRRHPPARRLDRGRPRSRAQLADDQARPDLGDGERRRPGA